MEIVLPLLALGGLYVVSSKKNGQNKHNQMKNKPQHAEENFANMGAASNYLPNTNIPPQNYPVPNINQYIETVQEYPNSNMSTDTYLDQNIYEQKVRNNMPVSGNIPEIYSLTGDYMDSSQFKHNNMTPFNGGKVKGNPYDINIAESVLDNMVGAASQVVKKVEQAPLFKPENNVQWVYGAPNQSDFYQSRVNPSTKINNVKPFDTQMVGPGLNQGYGVDGSNGYNSGMEARDMWMPKNVDELRVDTNPKMEYELTNLEGPANSYIKNVPGAEILGRIEKQRPDTFFVNSQDRWLTTNGAEKATSLRPIQETGIVRRNDIPVNYMGPAGAGDKHVGTAPQNYEPSTRMQLPGTDVNHCAAMGRGTHEDKDAALRSHTNYANHRSTVQQPDGFRSGFSGAISAVIAPLMDVLKPTRKDETIANVRIFGDARSVPKGYVYNPQQASNTTNKETTIYSPHFNINNQKEGMYVNNYTNPDNTQRDTTSCQYYTPAGGYATGFGDMSYEAAYRQHNNDIKSQSIDNRPNMGGTQMFNQQMHLSTQKSDSDRLDGRVNPAYSRLSGLPPSVNTYGTVRSPQTYDENAGCERINPDILTAFKNNPYTHSLTTSV